MGTKGTAMKASSLSLALTLTSLWGATATAETMVVDDQVVVRPATVELPARGQTMNAVEAKFGTPQTRHAAVGAPPITRWDYAAFSVFFENDRLIDAVAVGP
jgi:hypothetical protein